MKHLRLQVALGGGHGRVGHTQRRGRLFVRGETFALHEAGRTTMPGVFMMELVYYWLNESGLVMDGQNGVGGNVDPVFCNTVSESIPSLELRMGSG